MNPTAIVQLNNRFSINEDDCYIRFNESETGIPVVEIINQQAKADISLQGAHVLSWKPADEDEVIWLSDDVVFAEAKSVRGGIPICWPWFGAHENNATFPAHGFARTVLWQVTDTQKLPNGETQITFQLDTRNIDGKNADMWTTPTLVEYRLTIGRTLIMELITHNLSEQAITIGQALHTYFKVDDVSQTTVTGLDSREYLDKTLDFKRLIQTGDVTINAEVDRVYLQTDDDVIIDDKKRKITISKQGSHSTIVWNPWKDVAEKMGDLGEEGYMKMLCVESANASEDTVSIEPDDSHTLRVVYSLENSLTKK